MCRDTYIFKVKGSPNRQIKENTQAQTHIHIVKHTHISARVRKH